MEYVLEDIIAVAWDDAEQEVIALPEPAPEEELDFS